MAQCEDFTRLIITEGQLDSLTLAECGVKNAVSVPTGSGGFTWIKNVEGWISKFAEIVVFGDNEKGHVTLVDGLRSRLNNRIKVVRTVDYLGEKDANDILCKYGRQAVINCVENAKVGKMSYVKDLSDVKSVDLESMPKIKTNIKEIDKVIHGMFHTQLVVLTGKRGNGKSTFMSQLVCEALEQNETVFIYSGELADYHFKRWLDFQLAGSNHIVATDNEYGDKVYSLADDTVEQINKWYRGKAYIYDNSFIPEDGEELESLITTVEKVIIQYDVKFICIDNLMTAMEVITEQSNLYLAQSNFVGKLKKIALKYDVTVLLVAHPRKGDAEIGNDDVAGSSDITNKADIVMSYQRIDDNDDYNGRLSIMKNRNNNGRLARDNSAIMLHFSENTKRIYSDSSTNYRYGWEISYDDIEEIGGDFDF